MKTPRKIQWSKDRPVKPDIDPMAVSLGDLLRADSRSYYAKANVSGLAPDTLRKIATGQTKKPQALTVQMAYRMLGYELVPTPTGKKGRR